MSIKKLYFNVFFLVLFLLGVSTVKVWAADANIYLSPSSVTVDKTCYPVVDVMIDTGDQETTGVDIIINYDSTKLEVNKLTSSGLYDKNETLDKNTEGKIVIQERQYAGSTFQTDAGSAQKLATITFKTIAYGAASVSFKFLGAGDTTDTNIIDTEGSDILVSQTGATITVEDGATCPSLDSDDDDSDDSGDGGVTSTSTPTPTVYTAPVSGSTSNTIILLLAGTAFIALSAGLVFLKI